MTNIFAGQPKFRPSHTEVTVAAQWWADYHWNDLKCQTACDGELVQKSLLKFGDNGVDYNRVDDDSFCRDTDPEFGAIVLKWRTRDAFGSAPWDSYPEDVRAAFEAIMLAGEVPRAYAYASSVSTTRV